MWDKALLCASKHSLAVIDEKTVLPLEVEEQRRVEQMKKAAASLNQ